MILDTKTSDQASQRVCVFVYFNWLLFRRDIYVFFSVCCDLLGSDSFYCVHIVHRNGIPSIRFIYSYEVFLSQFFLPNLGS